MYRKFKIKDYDIQKEERSGRPTDDNEARRQEVSEEELEKELDVSDLSISCVIHGINVTYEFNRLLSHELIQTIKTDMFKPALIFSNINARTKFFTSICDEKWIYFKNTSRKEGWSAPGQPVGSISKRNLSNKMVMLCIWCDFRSIIHKESLEKSKVIDSKVYNEMLVRVQSAVKSKLRNEV